MLSQFPSLSPCSFSQVYWHMEKKEYTFLSSSYYTSWFYFNTLSATFLSFWLSPARTYVAHIKNYCSAEHFHPLEKKLLSHLFRKQSKKNLWHLRIIACISKMPLCLANERGDGCLIGIEKERGMARAFLELQIVAGEEERWCHHSECSYAERQTDAGAKKRP